jgi:hypothetical protein
VNKSFLSKQDTTAVTRYIYLLYRDPTAMLMRLETGAHLSQKEQQKQQATTTTQQHHQIKRNHGSHRQ